MPYTLNGNFIESCDCYVICPCWVDEDADDGNCTGLVAWTLGAGSIIDGLSVAGRTVVAVTNHGTRRRGVGTSQTVVYVDSGASTDQVTRLARAFSGQADGPLAELAGVSGQVVSTAKAQITVTENASQWSVRVRIPAAAPTSDAVDVGGKPKTFNERPDPMTLRDTALSTEFGMGTGAVTAHRSDHLQVAVAALPGGYIDVTGRSGMTGAFSYEFADAMPRQQRENDVDQDD